jgi:hypothetical protein
MLNISILLRKKEDKYFRSLGDSRLAQKSQSLIEIAAIAIDTPALLILFGTSGFIWKATD